MNIRCDTWFERDRAMVALVDADTNTLIIDWWDTEVEELVEAGFLSSDDWERSAIDYATHIGVLT